MAKKKKNIPDYVIADLLRQHLANSDKSLWGLCLATGFPVGRLTSVIRSLPAEFGIYNRNGKQHVKHFQGAAGTARADAGAGQGQRQSGRKGEFHCMCATSPLNLRITCSSTTAAHGTASTCWRSSSSRPAASTPTCRACRCLSLRRGHPWR